MHVVLISSSTILISSFLAFLFPYQALELSTQSLYILGMITLLAYLDYDFKPKFTFDREESKKSVFYLFIVFLLVPTIQWYLAYFLVEDRSLRLGLFLSSICPPALIIPLFLKSRKELMPKAHRNVLYFTYIFPVILLLLLGVYSFNDFQVSAKNLFVDIFCVTALPVSLLFILRRALKVKVDFLNIKIRQFLSLVCIALLTFCYFGTAYTKSNFATVSIKDMVMVVALVIFQDFGVYFLMYGIMKFFGKKDDLLLKLLGSMRNVAIAGYILIFYMPKAAVVPAMIMLVHSFYFIFIEYKLNMVKNRISASFG